MVNQSSVADEVFETIHELMHLYRSPRREAGGDDGEADGAPRLSRMEARALAFFARHSDATLTDLVAHAGRDKSQLARLVGGLREQGLLEGRPDPEDRRNVRLRLTAEAVALHRAMQRRHRRRNRAAVRGLSTDECGRLLALLGRIRDNLAADDRGP